jgi:hypothetical protein
MDRFVVENKQNVWKDAAQEARFIRTVKRVLVPQKKSILYLQLSFFIIIFIPNVFADTLLDANSKSRASSASSAETLSGTIATITPTSSEVTTPAPVLPPSNSMPSSAGATSLEANHQMAATQSVETLNDVKTGPLSTTALSNQAHSSDTISAHREPRAATSASGNFQVATSSTVDTGQVLSVTASNSGAHVPADSTPAIGIKPARMSSAVPPRAQEAQPKSNLATSPATATANVLQSSSPALKANVLLPHNYGIPVVLTSSNYNLLSFGGRPATGRIVVKNVDNKTANFVISDPGAVKVDANSSCLMSTTPSGGTCVFNISYVGSDQTVQSITPVRFKITGGNGSDYLTVNAINIPFKVLEEMLGITIISNNKNHQPLNKPVDAGLKKTDRNKLKTTTIKKSFLTPRREIDRYELNEKALKYKLDGNKTETHDKKHSIITPLQPKRLDSHYYLDGDNKNESWLHLYLSIMGGLSYANIGEDQYDVTIATSPYYNHYAPADNWTGAGVYGVKGGLEVNLSKEYLLSFGLGIYKSINHKAKGRVYISEANSDFKMFDYEYFFSSSRTLFETAFSRQFDLNEKIKFIPFIELGMGAFSNHVFNYEEKAANPQASPGAGFKSNMTTSFSYQIGCGGAITLLDHDRLFLSYKYVNLGDAQFASKLNKGYALTVGKSKAHEIYFGYTHLFNL